VKKVALKIVNNGRVYITRFFPMDPDDRVMESQCICNTFKYTREEFVENISIQHIISKHLY